MKPTPPLGGKTHDQAVIADKIQGLAARLDADTYVTNYVAYIFHNDVWACTVRPGITAERLRSIAAHLESTAKSLEEKPSGQG